MDATDDADGLLCTDEPITVIVVPGGMEGGEPSLMIRFDMPDGSAVYARTSARLFIQMAADIRVRYCLP